MTGGKVQSGTRFSALDIRESGERKHSLWRGFGPITSRTSTPRLSIGGRTYGPLRLPGFSNELTQKKSGS